MNCSDLVKQFANKMKKAHRISKKDDIKLNNIFGHSQSSKQFVLFYTFYPVLLQTVNTLNLLMSFICQHTQGIYILSI
jgi:hypothetical protein